MSYADVLGCLGFSKLADIYIPSNRHKSLKYCKPLELRQNNVKLLADSVGVSYRNVMSKSVARLWEVVARWASNAFELGSGLGDHW
jgi:hypothetical protein